MATNPRYEAIGIAVRAAREDQRARVIYFDKQTGGGVWYLRRIDEGMPQPAGELYIAAIVDGTGHVSHDPFDHGPFTPAPFTETGRRDVEALVAVIHGLIACGEELDALLAANAPGVHSFSSIPGAWALTVGRARAAAAELHMTCPHCRGKLP